MTPSPPRWTPPRGHPANSSVLLALRRPCAEFRGRLVRSRSGGASHPSGGGTGPFVNARYLWPRRGLGMEKDANVVELEPGTIPPIIFRGRHGTCP